MKKKTVLIMILRNFNNLSLGARTVLRKKSELIKAFNSLALKEKNKVHVYPKHSTFLYTAHDEILKPWNKVEHPRKSNTLYISPAMRIYFKNIKLSYSNQMQNVKLI